VLEFDDAVCRRIIEVKRPLKFIQVGAFDGITRDPLYRYIEDYRWQGILIEPQSRACEKLRRLHAKNPDVRIVNAAICAESGSSTLYTVPGKDLPEWCGGLASLSKDFILRHRQLVPGLEAHIVSETVKTLSFVDILRSMEVNNVDLLQIDAEGADAEILRLFPFSQLRPAIIQWEIKHLSQQDREATLDILSPFGYRFAFSGGEDMLAILADVHHSLPDKMVNTGLRSPHGSSALSETASSSR